MPKTKQENSMPPNEDVSALKFLRISNEKSRNASSQGASNSPVPVQSSTQNSKPSLKTSVNKLKIVKSEPEVEKSATELPGEDEVSNCTQYSSNLDLKTM